MGTGQEGKIRMTEKQSTDWSAVEKDYRAGIKTLRQMAGENGVSNVAIHKRAKKEGWTRDLTPKIRGKADELVRRDAVNNPVSREPGGLDKVSEREVVQANAEMQARVRREHRRDIMRLRRVANSLIDRLEAMVERREDFERAVDMLLAEDEVAGAEALKKAISLAGNVQSLESLSRTLASLIRLEREAYGIDAKAKEESSLERLMREVAAAEAAAAG